jgi:hypothetical protein
MAQRINPDDLPFDVPKFDEDEFVRKELISFRTTVVLFVYTIIIALVTYLVWQATGLTFLPLMGLALVAAVALKPIFKVAKIDISHWKRKEWVGTVLIYFFFWLGFVLLAFNPPFSDTAPPVIQAGASPGVQGPGGSVVFSALVRDNRALDEASVTLCLQKYTDAAPPAYDTLSDVQRAACQIPWSKNSDGVWTHNWNDTRGAQGTYAWFVHARDAKGQTSLSNGTVTIGTPLQIFVPAPSNAPKFDELTDQIIVKTAPGLNIRVVQYEISGTRYNMAHDAAKNQWSTGPEYPGWVTGSNLVTISAVEQPLWLDQVRSGGLRVEQANTTYTITVDPSLPTGGTAEPKYPETLPMQRAATPGLSLPLVALAILGLALVLRRR